MNLQQARVNLWFMVGLWVVKDAGALGDSPGFGIRRGVVEAFEAGGGNGTGTSGARLQGDPEVAIRKPFRLEYLAGGPDRENLGMGRGINALAHPVTFAGNDLAGFGDNRTHGNLAARGGGIGFFQRDVHETDELAHGGEVAAFHRAVKPLGAWACLKVNA